MPQSLTISIFGPRAGVGKSSLALNLSYAFARQLKKSTLLVDLDSQDGGDLEILLGVRCKHYLSDLTPNVETLLPSDMYPYLHSVEENFSFIPASSEPTGASQIIPTALSEVLAIFQPKFDVHILDCGFEINALSLAMFEMSQVIIFCTTPEVLTLQRSSKTLEQLQSHGFPSDFIELVVNEFESKSIINESVIKQKLDKNCLALLPRSFAEMREAVQRGQALFTTKPRHPYSQVIEKLARHLWEDQDNRQDKLSAMHSEKTEFLILEEDVENSDFFSTQDRKPTRNEEIKRKIHRRLIDTMDFRRLSSEELVKQDDKSLADLRQKTRQVIFQIIDEMPEVESRELRQQLTKEVLDEALGLGPLEDLIADEDVSEIMVNRYNQIYVEREGKLSLTPLSFTGDHQLLGVIERIVAPIGRRIDEKTPMVDARLRDGSRVHAIIPPISIDGPMLTIRKFTQAILTPDSLVGKGALTKDIAEFLKACVETKLNVLISGGTGTGKTTLLNVLSSFIPTHERIITVEDSAELQLSQTHVGRLESRPANLQGEGAIPIRELVRNTLRMRPDRIIIGECRGPEALDMLQAMNTGHDGSMATIHANSPIDCLRRLETLVMFAGMELPSKAVREQIGSAVQLIVQLTRFSDGSRKISAISEVLGMSKANPQEIEVQDIFVYKQDGIDAAGRVTGYFQATGLIPQFAEQLQRKGLKLPNSKSGGY